MSPRWVRIQFGNHVFNQTEGGVDAVPTADSNMFTLKYDRRRAIIVSPHKSPKNRVLTDSQ